MSGHSRDMLTGKYMSSAGQHRRCGHGRSRTSVTPENITVLNPRSPASRAPRVTRPAPCWSTRSRQRAISSAPAVSMWDTRALPFLGRTNPAAREVGSTLRVDATLSMLGVLEKHVRDLDLGVHGRRRGRLTVRVTAASCCLSARFSSATARCPRQSSPIDGEVRQAPSEFMILLCLQPRNQAA
jgi:hypothetical protein